MEGVGDNFCNILNIHFLHFLVILGWVGGDYCTFSQAHVDCFQKYQFPSNLVNSFHIFSAAILDLFVHSSGYFWTFLGPFLGEFLGFFASFFSGG